jgi:ABC-type multidrug transport system fused ATPase/permease subunit
MMVGHWHGAGILRRSDLMLDEKEFGPAFDWPIYRRLFGFVRPYAGPMALSVALTLAYTVTNLLNPYLIKLAIDGPIAQADPAGLGLISLLFLANSTASWLAQFGQTWFLSWVGQQVLYNLSSRMFNHVQRLSFSFFDANEVGRIMSRVQNDVQVLQEILAQGTVSLAADVVTLLGILAVLFQMNPRLALLTYLVLPLLVGITVVWQRRALESFRRVRAAISVVNATLQESVSGVRVIQALVREQDNLRRFDALNEQHLEANLQAGRVSALILPAVEVVSALATALVIIFGGGMVLAGSLEVGALVAFTLYINRFFDPIRDIAMRYTLLQRGTVAAERIFEVLDTKPEVADAPDAVELPPVRGEVVFENVCFWYVPDVPVLKGVDLRVEPGETIALVGPTGAGKSTLVRLIPRFYDVKEGRILIDGVDIRKVTLKSLRRQIAIVPQEPFLFSGTIYDNIKFARPEADDAEIIAAIRAVGLDELVAGLPRGIHTPVGERGQNLSVGQRQLISFARALLVNPRVLILDEATAYLDSQTEARLQAALGRVRAGRTTFIIAHRLNTVRDADRIVVLDQGRVVEVGTHAELLSRSGLYRRLYEVGFGAASVPRTGDGSAA